MQGTALGLISTQSFPAIVGTADMMLKSSGVSLVGYEKIGNGYCTAIVRGGIADIKLAVKTGEETARQFGQFVSSLVLPRPLPNLEAVLPISHRLADLADGAGTNVLSRQAVGLLETIGFPAMVGAADMMLKSADVALAAYETTGAGLCTAIIRGSIANVAVAVDAGMQEADRIGSLNAVMVIPRPLDDLEQTLPVASCWIEQAEPLAIPLRIKTRERDLVELPNFKELPVAESKELPFTVEEPLNLEESGVIEEQIRLEDQ